MLEVVDPFLNDWDGGKTLCYKHRVTRWHDTCGGWRLQNRHILIPQQRFLLCVVLSTMRWDRDLQIPIARRNIEFQNTDKQPNSVNGVRIIYVLSKHNGFCTSFLHSASAHAV